MTARDDRDAATYRPLSKLANEFGSQLPDVAWVGVVLYRGLLEGA